MIMRALIFMAFSIAALILGAAFVLPSFSKKEFVRVKVGKADIIAEVASDPFSRSRGLSGRKDLGDKAGMLFIFDKPERWGIWMKGMYFPIDVLWIRDGKIVDLREDLAPPPPGTPDSKLTIYRPDIPANQVLEVNAGFVGKFDIKIGDSIWIGSEASFLGEEKFEAAPEPVFTSSDEPGYEYFIETLKKNPPRGKNLKIEKELENKGAYKKFLVSYQSGSIPVTAVMNIPTDPPPPGGYPILILNHGLISPDVYYTGRGSKREQDFFARHGYITIHPDYRYHAVSPKEAFLTDLDSSPRGRAHHDFYVGYTEDVMALLDALQESNHQLWDVNRIGMWGHSMGGGITARIMVLRPEVRAYVLFAPLSAEVEDNFYELPQSEISWLAQTYGIGRAASEVYKKISPLTYFSDVSAPVQLHHGTSDKDVPITFSEKMFTTLRALGKKVEFYTYADEGHEFGEAWLVAAERALQFFDRYVKNAR
jgi:uncharacterized membrane protein (UPF0127 family)/dienelactone hydrolase